MQSPREMPWGLLCSPRNTSLHTPNLVWVSELQFWGEVFWQAQVTPMAKSRGGSPCPSIEIKPVLLYKCSLPQPQPGRCEHQHVCTDLFAGFASEAALFASLQGPHFSFYWVSAIGFNLWGPAIRTCVKDKHRQAMTPAEVKTRPSIHFRHFLSKGFKDGFWSYTLRRRRMETPISSLTFHRTPASPCSTWQHSKSQPPKIKCSAPSGQLDT